MFYGTSQLEANLAHLGAELDCEPLSLATVILICATVSTC